MISKTASVAKQSSRSVTVLLVVDMESWQEAGRLEERDIIQSYTNVLICVFYRLGKIGHCIQGLCVLVKASAEDTKMDGLLQHYNGLQLVGPGHEVDDMEAAMTAAYSSPACDEQQVFGVIATDHGLDADNPTFRAMYSLLDQADIRILPLVDNHIDSILGFVPEIEVASQSKSVSDDNETEEPAATQPNAASTIDDVAPREETDVSNGPASPGQDIPDIQALLGRISILEQKSTPAVEPRIETLRCDYLDFVPLVKTVREYQYSLSAKKKPLRSGVALDLMDNYSWPIGEEGYTTFRRYTQAAETAEFVHLGDCKYGPTIYSTGRLEGILNIKPSKNYTQGWPRVH